MRHATLTLIVLGIAVAGQMPRCLTAQGAAPPVSPTVRTLATAIAGTDTEALNAFWREQERVGTPLVETHPHPDTLMVTFLYRGGPGVRSVRVSSGLNAVLVDGITSDFSALGHLRRLPDTDVWHLTFNVGRNVRVEYRFEVTVAPDTAPTEVMDSLNPHVYRPDRPALRASLLELPGAPPQPWNRRGEELGSWRQGKFTDRRGRENDVYIYLPAGFDAERVDPYPVLVGLDSYSFGIGMPGALLLDHLIATNAIPPTVLIAANLPAGDGLEQMDVTADYVADRLLPELRRDLNLATEPRYVVIAGTSRRGLIATYVAFTRPEVIGNVLSLSGSFYWKPDGETEYEWLTRRFATERMRVLRLFVAAGNLETLVTPTNRGHYMVATNRHLRDVLHARGYNHTYWEFAGAHSALSWQDALAVGLTSLLNQGQPASH